MTEETLFAAALERPAGVEREAFLAVACAGDTALRDRVERLLAADQRSSGILDRGPDPADLLAACEQDTAVANGPPGATPSARRSRAAPESDPPGYELFEAVGEGGMGVVYRARDTRLDRDVAVKLLHSRFTADGPAAKRFLGEARVTAQLQHPGVPPVHEVGALPDGRLFLVMKLIKGRTLAELLANERTERGPLLAAFEQVCQAVGYAHSKRVVHRDLKPSNVMVGAFAEVQVMDWGLAKVLAPATGTGEPTVLDEATAAASAIDSDRGEGDATRTGSVLGTPAYMPPEQAIGAIDQIDQRSDVFGLGAILCAVLTGQPPYVGTEFEAVRQLAARAKLGDAFTRLDACGADPGLVGLCKRCLAPEKDDRPADAGEVARAVAGLRAAADERVRAAEVDRVRAEGERAKAESEAREQRKRRRVQAVLGLALTAVVALVGFGLWWNERHEADRARRQERTVASVSAALDDARVRIGEAWAMAAEPDKMRATTDLALAAVRRAEGFVDSGEPTADTLNELAAVRADATELDRHTRLFVAADLALRHHDIGLDGHPDVAMTAGRLQVAFRDFGWDPLRTPPAEIAEQIAASRVRNKILGFLFDWEYALRSQGLPDQEKVWEVIRTARLRSGGLLAEWQRVRDTRDPAQLVAFSAKPEVLTLGPELLCALGRNLEDTDQHDACYSLMRRAAERYPTHVWVNYYLSTACGHVNPQRWVEALRAASAAATARPDSAMLQMILGNCFSNLKDHEQAIACYRKAIALAPRYGSAYYALAGVLTRRADRDGALAVYREYVRQAPDSALAHCFLGSALLERGKPDEAIAELLEAVRLEPNYAAPHIHLGRALLDKGDVAGAITAYREVLRLNPHSGDTRIDLAQILQRNGDPDGAVFHFREVIRLSRREPRPHNELAWLLATGPDRVRDGKLAVEHATRACELTQWKTPHYLDTLAAAYAEAGDFDQAVGFQMLALSFPPDYRKPVELTMKALSFPFPLYERDHRKGAQDRLELYTQKKPYRDPALALPEVAPPPRAVKP